MTKAAVIEVYTVAAVWAHWSHMNDTLKTITHARDEKWMGLKSRTSKLITPDREININESISSEVSLFLSVL